MDTNCAHIDADFDLNIVNFRDGDVPRTTFHGVYFSQLVCFSRDINNVKDFNKRSYFITEKKCYRYQKVRKTFCKFIR